MFFRTVDVGAGKGTQLVKELATKSDKLSSIPTFHMVEGEN